MQKGPGSNCSHNGSIKALKAVKNTDKIVVKVKYQISVFILVFKYYSNTSRLLSICALTLLDGRHEEHPACKNRVMRCWCGYLSGASADCLHMLQLMPLPSQIPIIFYLI